MSSSSYADKLKDPRWQKKRLEVMERDGFACRDCGEKSKTLHVHHCIYERGGPWNTTPMYLLTLCHDCHETREGLESDAKKMLAKMMIYAPDLQYFVERLAECFGPREQPISYLVADETNEANLNAYIDAKRQVNELKKTLLICKKGGRKK